MILFSHPTGNSFVRQATCSLSHAGLLAEFHTCIATFPGNLLDCASKLPGMGELQRRAFDPSFRDRTHTQPCREAGRLLAQRLGLHRLTAHETGPFCIDAVYHSLDRAVAKRILKLTANRQPPTANRPPPTALRQPPTANRQPPTANRLSAVYAYEDGALESFRAAKSVGANCLYDLPIGYWRAARRLLEVERERWPDWAATLTGFRDSPAKLERKDEELRLADRIFVASSFTKKTLADFPGPLAPIEVIPYGFPEVTTAHRRPPTAHSPLKLLFVGGLSQRKGIADLFAAVEAIGVKHVSLTVVGRKAVDGCAALDAALARHQWIPSLPHAEILALMRQHDVLVFPSLFEGFGLVITEAMSQGTPVITTDRTAGPDLIEHGRNGWLIEAGNTAALQAQIEDLLANPAQIADAGKEAIETARSRPWSAYGNELANAIR